MPSIRVQKKRRFLRRQWRTFIFARAPLFGVETNLHGPFTRPVYERLRNVITGKERSDFNLCFWPNADGQIERIDDPGIWNRRIFFVPPADPPKWQLADLPLPRLIDEIEFRGTAFGYGGRHNQDEISIRCLLYLRAGTNATARQKGDLNHRLQKLFYIAVSVLDRDDWRTPKTKRVIPKKTPYDDRMNAAIERFAFAASGNRPPSTTIPEPFDTEDAQKQMTERLRNAWRDDWK
jgi:hypothetical protein